jgi:hypothetical protein
MTHNHTVLLLQGRATIHVHESYKLGKPSSSSCVALRPREEKPQAKLAGSHCACACERGRFQFGHRWAASCCWTADRSKAFFLQRHSKEKESLWSLMLKFSLCWYLCWLVVRGKHYSLAEKQFKRTEWVSHIWHISSKTIARTRG